MSLTLLFVCRRSVGLANWTRLRPLHLSRLILTADSSSFRTNSGSMKSSSRIGSGIPINNPFRVPIDEKSRRLKLQEQIRFREKYDLGPDFELIYAMPRQRMYGMMHFLCTCATVTMTVFILMHFHHEMLDMDSLLTDTNKQIPVWVLYSVATVIGGMFATILVLCSWMPIRVYHAPTRRLYALFYHPTIGVFRHKKILFADDKFRIIPQKLDVPDSPQRSIKIRIDPGTGFLSTAKSFYLVESLFRSKRDIEQLRSSERSNVRRSQDETTSQAQSQTKSHQTQEETEDTEMWQTVLERKDQPPPPRTTSRGGQ